MLMLWLKSNFWPMSTAGHLWLGVLFALWLWRFVIYYLMQDFIHGFLLQIVRRLKFMSPFLCSCCCSLAFRFHSYQNWDLNSVSPSGIFFCKNWISTWPSSVLYLALHPMNLSMSLLLWPSLKEPARPRRKKDQSRTSRTTLGHF